MSNRVPIGLLITSIKNSGEGTFSIYGYWYHKEIGLPKTKAERKNFYSDLMKERCCQVQIDGSTSQIEEIVAFAYSDFFKGDENEEKVQKEIVTIMNFLKSTSNAVHIFEDLMKPMGNSLPANIVVVIEGDYNSIKKKIHSKTDLIKLKLDSNWSLMKDLFGIP
jgi:hypothetical protein